mgnify:CR=1 FL=1
MSNSLSKYLADHRHETVDKVLYLHLKVGIVRTSLEVSVCVLGYILGGTVGIGTVVFAAAIGWIVQLCLNSIARLPHLPHEGDNIH